MMHRDDACCQQAQQFAVSGRPILVNLTICRAAHATSQAGQRVSMKPLLFIAAACVVLASTILASASSETGTDAGVTFVNVSYWSGPAYVVSRVHVAGYWPADMPLRTAQA